MKKWLTVIVAVVVLSVVVSGLALAKGSDQGQRPFMTRTVFTKTLDPNANGDVVISHTVGDSTVEAHYARFATNLASVSDPPMVELYYQDDWNTNFRTPPNSIVPSNAPGFNSVYVRNGEILVLIKWGSPGRDLANTIPVGPDGKIHLKLVVAK